jgi:lipopolysaccharide transport system permease protein
MQEGAADEIEVVVIKPPRRMELVDGRELWRYRELLFTLAARQVRVRYKQTVLGIAWAFIQPVVQMLVFTVIFGRMAKLPSEGYPYPVFVYSGLLAWNYFSNATSSAVGSLVANGNLLSKVYFPRLIIPLASVLAGLVDFLIASVVLVGLMLYFGIGLTSNIVMLPLLIVGLMLAATGVGTALGALNVVYRDLQHGMTFLMQVWLYATPVVYSPDSVPDAFRWVLLMNPITGFIDGFRAAFLGRPFDASALVTSLAISTGIFVAGALYFHHAERRFADVV